MAALRQATLAWLAWGYTVVFGALAVRLGPRLGARLGARRRRRSWVWSAFLMGVGWVCLVEALWCAGTVLVETL